MATIRVLVLIVFVNAESLMKKPEALIKYEQMCRNVTEDPFFKENMLIGHIWRIYYAWNMILGNECVDIEFKTATTAIISRFREDTSDYLEEKPDWKNATLLMTMPRSQEMLLIPDYFFPGQMPDAGRFVGIPNILKGNYVRSKSGTLEQYKMAMKFYKEGRFLVMGDCMNGVVSFLVRRDQKHTWGEVTSVVNSLGVKFNGEGSPCCKFNMRRKPHKPSKIKNIN